MDFATLKEKFLELLGRQAVSLAYDMATAELDRTLRIREMEVTATLVVAGGKISLPADFLEPQSVKNVGGCYLNPISHERLTQTATTGTATHYVVGNGHLALNPAPEDGAEIEVVYFSKNTALVDEADTNAALQGAPEAYVFTALTNHARLIRDTAAVQFWELQALKAVADANRAATAARFNGGTLEVTPVGSIA